jgi:hypothetical protein
MLVDQPIADLSEDRSAAPNIEQDLKYQNAKELIFTEQKTTAAMKRSLTSVDDEDLDELKVIRKRSKEGNFFDSDN